MSRLILLVDTRGAYVLLAAYFDGFLRTDCDDFATEA